MALGSDEKHVYVSSNAADSSEEARTTGIETAHPSSHGVFKRFLKKMELKSSDSERLSNEDMDPVPWERRTWRWYNLAIYWISDAFAPGGWRGASSLMEIGLSWRLSLLNIAIANIIMAVVITLNSHPGAHYHVCFPVFSRVPFGFWFSYVMVFMRMITGIFWYGINTYTGAECVRTVLFAIWPSFRTLKNTLPESANITTNFMISWFIYFLLCIPVHLIKIENTRWYFLFKTCLTPICGFAIVGWIAHKMHGMPGENIFSEGSTVSGSKLTWAFMSALYSNMGGSSTYATNASDYSRYTRKEYSILFQLVALPFSNILMAVLGVVGAAGSKKIYGEILWDPLLLIDNWTSRGGRAAAAFCGIAFLVAQIGQNISANSVAAANDLNCIFPKYINIRRGQIIVAFLGAWALTPWNILTSATAFLSFMSGYSIWLSSIAGILFSDYWLVHKRKYDVYELYNPKGIYLYNKWGFNWRALVAFTVGWVPLLPGFINAINSNIYVVEGMIRLYYLGFFYGFGASSLVYYGLCYFFPQPETYIEHEVLPPGKPIASDGIEAEEYIVGLEGGEYGVDEKKMN
ncbi:permease for cytosine/purines, uracil, thiamine, allantoin-domain-containing protein [Myxozyma melibiosi]|uniref:Permease for cytosine/purines, uracil, thiamine, allantoin-domain-containing protein n=1 Tax=Myxozyma melibiosi TaxID=54550 RepID=A0ABR1EZJ6_9ASCO